MALQRNSDYFISFISEQCDTKNSVQMSAKKRDAKVCHSYSGRSSGCSESLSGGNVKVLRFIARRKKSYHTDMASRNTWTLIQRMKTIAHFHSMSIELRECSRFYSSGG